jgi:carbonic anhydrase
MRKISAVLFCLLTAALFLAAQPPACDPCKDKECPCPTCVPDRADLAPLAALQAGNDQFIKGPKHPRQSPDCATKLRCCQAPFAIVLSCSDSRVPPEVIFDQGIGDLFVVRVAGNVAGYVGRKVATPAVLGSIEYAVEHFHVYTIVVLGHQRCGAVEAAFGDRPGPHLNAIWSLIRPAIPAPRPKPIPDDIWERAIRVNVDNMVKNLHRYLRVPEEDRKKLLIKGAYFSLETGALEPRISP